MSLVENRKDAPRWFHASVEWGPSAIFLLAYHHQGGLHQATAALMAATAAAFALSWVVSRRIPVMPFVTLVLVVVFGGLTLWLRSELFVKTVPTIVNATLAIILVAAYARDLPVLKRTIGCQMPEITAPAWRRLTLRYALFFAALALLNEMIWRTQSTDLWVAYKTYGDLCLLLLFIASQIPFIGRHRVSNDADDAAGTER